MFLFGTTWPGPPFLENGVGRSFSRVVQKALASLTGGVAWIELAWVLFGFGFVDLFAKFPFHFYLFVLYVYLTFFPLGLYHYFY